MAAVAEANTIDSYLELIQPNWTAPERQRIRTNTVSTFGAACRVAHAFVDYDEVLLKQFDRMNTITPNVRRVYMSRDIASSCANMCLFIADCQRFGLDPTPYDHALAAAGGYNPDHTVFTMSLTYVFKGTRRIRMTYRLYDCMR